ncbi:MAG: chromate transporter [Thermosediminibacteraceae bacterium]|nr:chromate transporter [Thermosediminibacteraceae bacterium]
MDKKISPRQLVVMFWTFFKIGAFTLGGGFAMIPLMKAEFVDRLRWLKEEEFLDIIAVSQCVPGVVAINSSVYIGYKLYGFLGAAIAALGTVLPSFLIILAVALVYNEIRSEPAVQKAFRGIYPALVVLVLAAAINLRKAAFRNFFDMVVAIACLIALLIDVHPIFVIIAAGTTGILSRMWRKRWEEGDAP